MALEDIIDASRGTTKKDKIRELGETAKALKSVINRINDGKGPSESGDFPEGLMSYILAYSGDIEPEHTDLSFLRLLSPEELNPIMIKYLPSAYKNARKGIVENVKDEYSNILKELDGNSLFGIVSSMPIPKTVKKEYEGIKSSQEETQKYSDIVEKKDAKKYVQGIKNKVIKEIMEKVRERDENVVLEYAQKRAQIEQQKFLKYFTDDLTALIQAFEKKDLGAINKAFKLDDLREYAQESVKNSSNPEDAYETVASIYSNYLSMEEIRAKNEKSKKALSKAA